MTYTAAERRRIKDERYRKRRLLILHRGGSTSLVPARPVSEHAAKLIDLGWSSKAIQQLIDGRVSDTTIMNLARGRHATIERKTAAVVLAVPHSLAVPRTLDPTVKVPMLGAQRRVQAMLRMGWTHAFMRAESGVDTSHLARGTYGQTIARKAWAVEDMARQFGINPGPSRVVADRALRRGHVSLFAWDDIDDPNERPKGRIHAEGLDWHRMVDEAVVERVVSGQPKPRKLTNAEAGEVVRRLLARGVSKYRIEKEWGLNIGRYGREDGAA